MEGVTIVNHPLVQHKLTLMRDKNTPTAHFRQLLREIALLLTYEVTRDLPLTTTTIETPLAKMECADPGGQEAGLRLDPAGPATACSKACSTSSPRPASPISASTASPRRWSRSSITSRRPTTSPSG